MAKSKFSVRERVWQCYSPKLWERILKNCSAGITDARADLRWFYDMFRADDSLQEEMFGRSYPEVRRRLAPCSLIRNIMFLISLPLGAAGFYGLASHISDTPWIVYALTAFFVTLMTMLFVNHIKAACEEPKDLPLLFVYVLLFIIAAAVFRHYIVVVIAIFFLMASMLAANVEFWTLRALIVELVKKDYEFFKQTSGRPAESYERPPLVFLKFVGDEQQPVAWDINPEPVFPENISKIMNTTVIGHSFDVFLPKVTTQVLTAIAACWSVFPYPGVNWGVVGLSAAGLAVFMTYLCPSWYYAEFRKSVEKEMRRTSEDRSALSIQADWLVRCLLSLGICISAIAFLLNWLRTEIPAIDITSQL